MKKTAIITFIILILVACNTDQKKAEKLVKQYLKENLKDADSYKNIEMGDVKPLTWRGLFVQEDVKKVKNKELPALEFEERLKSFLNNMKEQNMNPDSIIAYTMEHKYRAKNSFGGYVISNVQYMFDTQLENIIDRQDVK